MMSGVQAGLPASLHVAGREIAPYRPAFLIAEIGINHEGDVGACGRMIEMAAAAGADAVKLQTVDADASYVKGTQSHEIFSKAALTPEETSAMFDLARQHKVAPLTTAGDLATLEWVDQLDPVAHKISSGLLTHTPMIEAAARTERPLIMSTGMAETADIDTAVATARQAGARGIIVLQCTSLYPAPEERINLASILALSQRYGVPAGFSDHALATDIAAMAVLAGALVIEKHFTFDRTRPGFDHGISLEADGFAEMVRLVRRAEMIRGTPTKTLDAREREMRAKSHRILVAARDIAAGEAFDARNLTLKRPLAGTTGLTPSHYRETIGRFAVRDLRRDEPVRQEDIGT